jgi:hypothetical protein
MRKLPWTGQKSELNSCGLTAIELRVKNLSCQFASVLAPPGYNLTAANTRFAADARSAGMNLGCVQVLRIIRVASGVPESARR